MHRVDFTPQGPFDLLHQNRYFNGWPIRADGQTIVMAFPVEGEWSSAAVELVQRANGSLTVTGHGTGGVAAVSQALAALSLDFDATGWPAVGERDPRLSTLQREFRWMRPSLFHSPYEAAAAFVIGHRISIVQTRRIRARMAAELGEGIDLGGEVYHAFPAPATLLQVDSYPGIATTKIERLHSVARAALEGGLTRTALRALDEREAIAGLEKLPGIGPFFAQGILHRGAGTVDGFTHDDLTYAAFGELYELGEKPSRRDVLAVAEAHRPFRMWAAVLLHLQLRRQGRSARRPY